jgi:hypothetical protein
LIFYDWQEKGAHMNGWLNSKETSRRYFKKVLDETMVCEFDYEPNDTIIWHLIR